MSQPSSRPSSSTIGRVRPLVPFFLPSNNGSIEVNEHLDTHLHPTHTQTSDNAQFVQLQVRQWDKNEGVFKHSTQIVRDIDTHVTLEQQHSDKQSSQHIVHDKPPQQEESSKQQQQPQQQQQQQKKKTNKKEKRLMTVQEIRALRRASKQQHQQPHVNSTSHQKPQDITKHEPTPHTTNPHQSPSARKQEKKTDVTNTPEKHSTPGKVKRYAGSTFEVASPPPTTFPIPSFARPKHVQETDAPTEWVEIGEVGTKGWSDPRQGTS